MGIMSIGIGAGYYSPDEHILLKAAYLVGCLILGLTFLDDWEDCVFDKAAGTVRLTRSNWCQRLVGSWFSRNSLALDISSVMAVRVLPTQTRSSKNYQVMLVLKAGGTVAVAETCEGARGEQEALASKIQSFLSLDRVEAVQNRFGELSDSDDDEFVMFQPPVEVECLKGRGEFNFEDIRFENENVNAFDVDEDDSDSNTTETSEALLDDP